MPVGNGRSAAQIAAEHGQDMSDAYVQALTHTARVTHPELRRQLIQDISELALDEDRAHGEITPMLQG